MNAGNFPPLSSSKNCEFEMCFAPLTENLNQFIID
jgi:hypothetical protein